MSATTEGQPSWLADSSEWAPAIAMEWLVEHLAFAVPMRMAEIAARVRAMPPRPWGLTWRDHVARIGRETTYLFNPGNAGVASSSAVLVAELGDSLFGQSSSGKAATVAANLTTALAAAALLNDDGVAFHGQHWCRTGACASCAAPRLAATQDGALVATEPPAAWWAPIDDLLAEQATQTNEGGVA